MYPNNISISWFGCFPKVKNDILVDIVVSVPEIVTEQDMLINLHEFYHAYELYNELGTIYLENREKREQNAISFEKKYIKKPI